MKGPERSPAKAGVSVHRTEELCPGRRRSCTNLPGWNGAFKESEKDPRKAEMPSGSLGH